MRKTQPKLKHFYIFRHGECPFNATGHIQGQTHDGSLTPKGCKQAELTGQKLADKKIEIIITSPMKRACQTAQIVNKYLNVPIWADHRLKEVNMGIVEGMHISEAEKTYADLYKKWRNPYITDPSVRFEKGESKIEVRQRVFEALDYYADETKFETIAISGHGITISQTLLFVGIQRSNIPNGEIIHLCTKNHIWGNADETEFSN